MSETILYSIPALVFLLVAGIVMIVANFVIKHYGPRARALSSRLEEIAQQRSKEDADRLLKEEFASHSQFMQWLEARLPEMTALRGLLIRAGSTRTPNQVIALCSGIAGFTFLAVFFAGAGIVAGLIGALLSGFSPIFFYQQKEKKRRLKFEEQLPEALDFMSRALRAGHGLAIAIGMVGNDMAEPIGPEFKLVFEQINFDVSFNEALSNLTTRINSSDLNFFVVAVLIQRETGGNLTELLSTLAKTVRERLKFRGKVQVLASEGKFSGILLGSLPFILAGILSLINPVYMSSLWTSPTGHTMISTGLIMIIIGFAWMWKIVQIRV